MKKWTIPHLKLGGTSCLLHAAYVPAVRFTAERCEDVALLLLEAGEDGRFFISRKEAAEIARIIDGEGASLHVHLPTDADFDTAGGARRMVAEVREAVERAARLRPHSFVLHVDFPSLHGRSPDKLTPDDISAEQRQWTAEALAEIAAFLPSPDMLAVENLENFTPYFWDGWLDGAPYSRCLDIGHIWKTGGDPAPVLAAQLSRVRVIHLHGLKPRAVSAGNEAPPRDHASLWFMPPDRIDAVMHPLWRQGFAGVLNLEVFRPDDFASSHAVLLQSWERYAGN